MFEQKQLFSATTNPAQLLLVKDHRARYICFTELKILHPLRWASSDRFLPKRRSL
jgi:hypothetical protein